VDRADVEKRVEALAAWDLSVSKAERADAFMELYDEAVDGYEKAMTVLNMQLESSKRLVDALTERTRKTAWLELKLVELEDENERLRKLESDSVEVVVDDLHHGKISPARAVERLRRLM